MFSLEDAQQRWTDTILFHRGLGRAMYVESVVDFNQEAQRAKLKFYTTNDGSWDVHTDWMHIRDIVEAAPVLGMVNLDLAAHYITRKATHQFRRGLVPKQLTVSRIGDTDELHPQTKLTTFAAISPTVLDQYYEPTYPSMLEAVRDVSRGMYLSRAFSINYAVAAERSKWPILYYKAFPIGKVKADCVELVESAAFLREDVQDNTPLHVVIATSR